jgi:hypothetical protein
VALSAVRSGNRQLESLSPQEIQGQSIEGISIVGIGQTIFDLSSCGTNGKPLTLRISDTDLS